MHSLASTVIASYCYIIVVLGGFRHFWLLLAIFRQSYQAKLMHDHITIFLQTVHYLCCTCPWHINLKHCASETGLTYVIIFSKREAVVGKNWAQLMKFLSSRPVHFIKGIFILFTLANPLSRQQSSLSFSRWLLASFWFCCQIVGWRNG